jgi:hypothetical protein
MGKISGPNPSPIPPEESKASSTKKGFFATLFEKISSFFSRSYTGVGLKWEDHRLEPLSPDGLAGTTLKTHLVAYSEEGVFKFHNLNILMPKQSDDLDAMKTKLRAIQDLKQDLESSKYDTAKKELSTFIQRIESQFKVAFESLVKHVEDFSRVAEQFSNGDLTSSAHKEFKKAATTFLLDEKKGLEAFKALAKKYPEMMKSFLELSEFRKKPKFLNEQAHSSLLQIVTSSLEDLDKKRKTKDERQAQLLNEKKKEQPVMVIKTREAPQRPQAESRPSPPASMLHPQGETKTYYPQDILNDNEVARFLFTENPELQQKYKTLCRQCFDSSEEVRLEALQKLAQAHPQEMKTFVRSIDNFGNDRFKNPFLHRWFDGKYEKFSQFKKFVLNTPHPSSSFYSSSSYTPPQNFALTHESELDRLPEFVTRNLSTTEKKLIIAGEAQCYLDHPFHGWPRWVLKDLSGNLLKIFEIPPQNKEEGPSRWDV